MENWEALDVDDSDLPSLLRPCIKNNTNNKRKNPTTLSTSSPSQTLISPPQPDSVARNRIPGPAGAVQVAMERKKRGGCEVSTQECIRRAVANDANDDDVDDFGAGPWLSAVDFVTRLGPLPSTTPLRSISKFLNIGKIDQVVAVIKSCSPNGLGDLMVMLKDPTGTVGASIHRKVFSNEEFGKDISVGSVLILQKVAVFSPSRSALYLNITRSNVVKVFSGDSRPPTNQKEFLPAVEPTSAHFKETAVNVEEATSMEVEITQGINSGTEKYRTPAGSVIVNIDMEKEKFANSSTALRRDQDDISAENILKKGFQKEITRDATSMEVEMTQGFNSGTGKLPNLTGSGNMSREMGKENNANSSFGVDQSDKSHISAEKMPKKVFGKEKEQRDPNAAANLDECQIIKGITRSINGVEKEKQPLTATAFPEWTDEQLNELFSAGFDNDGCFF